MLAQIYFRMITLPHDGGRARRKGMPLLDPSRKGVGQSRPIIRFE